jgi:transcriptional regulator with XRE-family HTH domain
MKKNEVKFPLQVVFLEKLKKTISKNISLADELAEVLGVSLDSAYRRLRGDSALSYDETMTICTKFNISPSIMENKETGFVNFTYKSLGVERVKLSGYLESIKKEFLQLHEFSNIHFYFAAEDVPLFHHLDFEYLTPFKYFYWRKSILNDTTLDGKKFDKKLISPEVINLSKEISRLLQKRGLHGRLNNLSSNHLLLYLNRGNNHSRFLHLLGNRLLGSLLLNRHRGGNHLNRGGNNNRFNTGRGRGSSLRGLSLL